MGVSPACCYSSLRKFTGCLFIFYTPHKNTTYSLIWTKGVVDLTRTLWLFQMLLEDAAPPPNTPNMYFYFCQWMTDRMIVNQHCVNGCSSYLVKMTDFEWESDCTRAGDTESDGLVLKKQMSVSDIFKTDKCSVKYFNVWNKGATPRERKTRRIFVRRCDVIKGL